MTRQYPRKSDGRKDSEGKYISGLGDPGVGGYLATRKNKFGNQVILEHFEVVLFHSETECYCFRKK